MNSLQGARRPLPRAIGRVTIASVVLISIAACTAADPVVQDVSVTPEPATTVVPNLLGSTVSEARHALAAAGLRVVVSKLERANNEPGTVVDQDPSAGSSVDPGATVEVTIAIRPIPVGRAAGIMLEPTTTTVDVTWAAPRSGSPVAGYEIWRDGKKIGERVAGHRVFRDTGLLPGTTHRYLIVSVGKNGTRLRSVSRSVTLDVPVPDPVPAPAPAPAPAPPPPPPPSPVVP